MYLKSTALDQGSSDTMQCYKFPGVIKVVTRWGEGADVVKILCSLCLFNCKQATLIEILLCYQSKSCTCAGHWPN